MKQELKYIITSTIKATYKCGGLKISPDLLQLLSEEDNWFCVASKSQIINNATMWCYEFKCLDETITYFMQIELQTEFKTVVAINLITDINSRIISYA